MYEGMFIVYYRENDACLCRESGSEGIGEEDAGAKAGARQKLKQVGWQMIGLSVNVQKQSNG